MCSRFSHREANQEEQRDENQKKSKIVVGVWKFPVVFQVGLFREVVIYKALDGFKVLVLVRVIELFEGERERSVIAGDTLDGGLEIGEALFLSGGADFSGKTGGLGGFVGNDESTSFLDTLNDGFSVPRKEGAEIDEFAFNAELLARHLASLVEDMDLSAPANDGDVLTFTNDTSLSERHLIVADGDLFNSLTIQPLGLEENDRIGVANARQQKSLGIERCRRNNDLQTRRMAEVGLGRLRVIMTSMTNSSIRRTDRQTSHIEHTSTTITIFSGLIHDLIESREDIIRELNLGNRGVAHSSHTNSKTSDTLFHFKSTSRTSKRKCFEVRN